jgi:hypothetical protein
MKKEIEKLVNKIVEKVWNKDCDCTKEEMKKEYYEQIHNTTERSSYAENLMDYLDDIEEFELFDEVENLLIQLNT